MAITLDLRPELEARLLRDAEATGVPVSVFVENLIGDRLAAKAKEESPEAYIERVKRILVRFDELPRMAPHLSAEEIIGYDEWGLPT
jgi:hypothetical protein